MKFVVGQTVMLINNDGMRALVGSMAVIRRIDSEFLYIKWVTSTQSDGAYYPFHFRPMPRKNQQLLFAFME